MLRQIGAVAELWRYPVKSMRGERLTRAELDAAGVVGDRRFAFASTAAPAGKPLLSSRERTRMLRYLATLEPEPRVTTGSGAVLALDSSELLLALASEVSEPGATLSLLASPERPYTDVRSISLVTTATLSALNDEVGRGIAPQRFRSNLVLTLQDSKPFAEDALQGKTLFLGRGEDAPALRLRERIPRCRIISVDPQTTETDPLLLKHLAAHHEGRLGMYANVLRPGRVFENSPVVLLD